VLIDSVDFFRSTPTAKLARQALLPRAIHDRRPRLLGSWLPCSRRRKQQELTSLILARLRSLTAAFVSEVFKRKNNPPVNPRERPSNSSGLCGYLCQYLRNDKKTCESRGVAFDCDVIQCDFNRQGAGFLTTETKGLRPCVSTTAAIMNPP